MFFGERLGKIVGKRVEVVGGLILIGIGIKIVIDHMA
jgi:putative Mn2+ efflux pump MntP